VQKEVESKSEVTRKPYWDSDNDDIYTQLDMIPDGPSKQIVSPAPAPVAAAKPVQEAVVMTGVEGGKLGTITAGTLIASGNDAGARGLETSPSKKRIV
jgi:hypothetical protein